MDVRSAEAKATGSGAVLPPRTEQFLRRLEVDHERPFSGKSLMPDANLDEIDLGRDTLAFAVSALNPAPAWWSVIQQGVDLEKADLSGISLRQANLRGGNLKEANLRDAILAGADLQAANLERADMTGADLAGTRLDGALLSGVEFAGSMLEDAVFTNSTLRFAKFSDCILEGVSLQRADLWGANLERADLAGANLSQATLMEARLAGANLDRVNLERVELGGADLKGANLRGARLEGATLRGANLEAASLKEAELSKVDLLHANIKHAYFSGADLEKTRFRLEQIGGTIGEELSGDYEEARLGYLALERNFADRGETEAESWAYRKRRRMGKCAAWKRAQTAGKTHRWSDAFRNVIVYLSDVVIEWTCDYGESIGRVVATIIVIWLLFAVIYGITGSVVIANSSGSIKTVVHNPFQIAVFSLYAMTTTGTMPFAMQPRDEYVQLAAGLEGLLAVALTGLLGFVAGNRIRR